MVWAMILIASTPTACAVAADGQAGQLALPYENFDSGDGQPSWRQLLDKGCTDAAVQLLTRYDEANAAKLSADQRSELAFHRGQALAFAARDAESLPHFENALAFGVTDEWTTYVSATIAFLRRDQDGLQQARVRYSAIAPGSMREKFLRGLEACPSKSYMVAVHCAL